MPVEIDNFNQNAAFLQVVSDISHVPSIYWTDSALWLSAGTGQHPCDADRTLLHQLMRECQPEQPGIFLENNLVIWGVIRVRSCYAAIGPALINNDSDGKYGKRYAKEHGLDAPYSFGTLTFGEMSKYLSLLSCHFLGRPIPYDDIALWGLGSEHARWESEDDLSQYQLVQAENDRSHQIGRDYEEKVVSAVRSGDVELAKQLMGGDTPSIGEAGEVAKEEQKQVEYMIVSLLAVLTRAAVDGGMRPEAAYNLGDIYLRRLAAAVSHGGALTVLAFRAVCEFAEGVRQAKKERSEESHIEACKAYIEANLLKNIRVGDISPALGLSRCYLTRLFKREEGITLQQYIQREKCRFAERQLKYTDYSVALISEYFGFSSPGYFSTCFQHWYGVTPAMYRRINSRK